MPVGDAYGFGGSAPVRSTIMPVVLGPAVPREVEHRLLVGAREVEIAARGGQLVAERRAAGDDLARGRDDGALADHVAALLAAALGDAHHPGGILVRARLHHQVVVEGAEEIVLGRGRIVHGGVVAEADQLHPLQAHHAIGLGPAPVIADAHADDAVEGAPHREAEIAHVEVALLEVLEGAPGLVLGVAGQVHLPVLADEAPRAVHQDRRCCSGARGRPRSSSSA